MRLNALQVIHRDLELSLDVLQRDRWRAPGGIGGVRGDTRGRDRGERHGRGSSTRSGTSGRGKEQRLD